MKNHIKSAVCIGLSAVLLLLCGCQKSPEKDAVISKNDGAFDIAVLETATQPEQSAPPSKIVDDSVFYSTDGSVEYRMAIDEEERGRAWPVVEVAPHYLTEEEVKRVATALFGDVPMYEAEPGLGETYYQGEIQEKIQRWAPYTSPEALKQLLGEQSYHESDLEVIKAFIESYTEMYDSAPAENHHTPCAWTFRKNSYYDMDPKDLPTADLSDDNDKIGVNVQLGDIHYRFNASTRNLSDFKLNLIRAYVFDGMAPIAIDERIFRAWLCRTEEPTEAQLAAVREKAASILTQFQLGEWYIDQCYVETRMYGDTPEYLVHVNAVPVLNGAPAVRVPQLTSLRGTDEYAANYYITDVNFVFSANGELVTFALYSPVDVVNTVNDNVATKSTEELLELARNHLELTDYHKYGFGGVVDSLGEEIDCTVTITKLDANLMRVKVPDSDDHYYYIPAVVLKGEVVYSSAASGEVYYSEEDVPLVTINAVDGTIIAW